MSDPFGNRPFPRGPLIAAAILITVSVSAAATARLTRTGSAEDTAAVIATRDLRFEDRPDHAIVVLGSRSNQPIAVIAPGSNGFLRAALRGLARDRKREGDGDAVPFRLTARADGRLTLKDTSTGEQIELEAFGPANEQIFLGFFRARGAAR